MIAVSGFAHFGGLHHATAILRNLLTFSGVQHPHTGTPLSEALCFGLAGGIGVGYSFCPSIPRHGNGSGVTIVGRHRSYATDESWFQTVFDALGLRSRLTETTAPGKAYQNLITELTDARPTIVWCDRASLPYQFEPAASAGYHMYALLVYGIDEAKQNAYASERAATPLTIPLPALATSRARICSHKNRTLSLEPGSKVTLDRLRSALLAGLRSCAQELVAGKMKTFCLPGLEQWGKMIGNTSNKDGWGKVFCGGLFTWALLDVYRSINVNTGSELFRHLFVQTLLEASALLDRPALLELASVYARLGAAWSELADAALPATIKPLRQAAKRTLEREKLMLSKGEHALKKMERLADEVTALEQQWLQTDPLTLNQRSTLVADLQTRIEALHRDETAAAERLGAALA